VCKSDADLMILYKDLGNDQAKEMTKFADLMDSHGYHVEIESHDLKIGLLNLRLSKNGASYIVKLDGFPNDTWSGQPFTVEARRDTSPR
jgi:hypothetical protein